MKQHSSCRSSLAATAAVSEEITLRKYEISDCLLNVQFHREKRERNIKINIGLGFNRLLLEMKSWWTSVYTVHRWEDTVIFTTVYAYTHLYYRPKVWKQAVISFFLMNS